MDTQPNTPVLRTRSIAQQPNIAVIGCGGTGGFTAEALCRLLTGTQAAITLVDHDTVEPHNLLRQNFNHQDLGRSKSQALAERLSRQFQRPIAYNTNPFEITYRNSWPAVPGYGHNLILGCVDNTRAREAMHSWLSKTHNAWLVDAGNGRTWGQVLIGNATSPPTPEEAFPEPLVCARLPAPALQRPDLLNPPAEPPAPAADIDCAAAIQLTDQDPTINHLMASLIVHVVHRIITVSCTLMALYIDLEQGTVLPKTATPENMDHLLRHPTQEEAAANLVGQALSDSINRQQQEDRVAAGQPRQDQA